MRPRQKKIPGILWVMLFILITGIGYLIFSSWQKPKTLTTTIDIANKTINGNGQDDMPNSGDNNGTFADIAGMLTDSVSAALRDNITMLAAAAEPSAKFVKVTPGMRKEEIADLVGKKLAWNDTDKQQFLNINKTIDTDSAEGYYYPDSYILPADAGGYEVGKIMVDRFSDEIISRYASSTAKIVSVEKAMKIASIIEREAGGKSDMRLISGILWNRIFKNMTLDVDATLQYAKGSKMEGWWPKVEPEDKFIDSPYNTYQNKGLTPTPISNPHLAAIEAALNPKKTSCLFYLHDKYRRIHCSVTYKEHVRNIEKYYGRK